MSAGLLDIEVATVEWEEIHGVTFTCRDCGAYAWASGGSSEGGWYVVCEGCAVLDGCERRGTRWPEETGWPARHVSRWGRPHSPEDHEQGLRDQAKRRRKYLNKQAGKVAPRAVAPKPAEPQALFDFEVTDLNTGETFVVVQPELVFDDFELDVPESAPFTYPPHTPRDQMRCRDCGRKPGFGHYEGTYSPFPGSTSYARCERCCKENRRA